jgi:hypothetical protein
VSACAIHVFGETDEVTEQDVLDLWARDANLSAETVARRIGEVLMVAVDDELGLVGLVTTFLGPVEPLGFDMWVIRVFVATSYRRQGLVVDLFVAGAAELEARYVAGTDTRAPGTFAVYEEAGLRRRYSMAITPSGNVYIGDAPHGAPTFVRYFAGAVLPERAASRA